MDRETARQTVRDSWRSIIINYTGTAQKRVSGKETYICPFCGHGSGGDGLKDNPKSKDGNGIKCFGGGCDFSGDIIEFVQRLKGVDYNAALKMCADDIGITIDPYRATAAADFSDKAENGPQSDFKPAADKENAKTAKTPENGPQNAQTPDFTRYYEKCRENFSQSAGYTYLKSRGISLATAELYNLGYDEKADPANAPGATGNEYRPHPAPRLIMPVSRSFYVGRRVDGGHEYKKANPKGSKTEIFNLSAIYSDVNAVFIVESLIDALSIIEAGAAAVGLNSANNSGLFIDHLRKQAPRAKALILCLDNDDGGRRAAAKIETELKTMNIALIRANISGRYKDPNEALINDRKSFIDAVRAAERKAVQEAEKDDLTRFAEKIQTRAYEHHPTGLKFFDDLLCGGVVMQTVLLILAAPAAGKTTLCQQIAEEIAKRKKQVIYLNLEMSKEQMLAKAISARLAAADKGQFSFMDILQGYRWTADQKQIILAEIEKYRHEIFPYMRYNPAGITGDLDQLSEYLTQCGDASKAAGETAPAVVLDYLHLVSTSKGLDIQELIKQTMKTIKDYCIKYDTFAIIISAVNRDVNKTGTINMGSGRDSSNIEYGGDAEISLNYWELDQGKIKPSDTKAIAEMQLKPHRHMILRVLKARAYQAGKSAECIYHPKTNRFFEMSDFLDVNDDSETPFTEKAEQKPATPRRRG